MQAVTIRKMRNRVPVLAMSAMSVALAWMIAGCNNQTGFSGSVGSTPNAPKLTSYNIFGDVGTPFTATISDSRSSWTLQGNVPLYIVIINNLQPNRIVATKTTSNSNLLSLEIILANRVADLQSTSAPFGTVSTQAGGSLDPLPPPADPDLRIFASGPLNKNYTALVEDINTGFVIDARAPTLILFDQPDGKVDATFYGSNDFGTFTLNMTLAGQVVAKVTKGPNATIREP